MLVMGMIRSSVLMSLLAWYYIARREGLPNPMLYKYLPDGVKH
jgi:hypothetical protein